MRFVIALATLVAMVGLGACSSKQPAYLVFDDKVSTPTFDIPHFSPGRCHFDYRAQISMLDVETGKERWVTDVPWPNASPMIVANERLFLATAEGGWVGLDAAKGRPLWQRRFAGSESELAARSVLGDTLTTIDKTDLVGFAVNDGTRRWQVSGPRDQMLSIDGALALVVRQDASSAAVDRRNGKVLWSAPPMARGNGALFAGISRDVVVVAAQNGPMRGLDRTSGRILWEHDSEPGRYRSPLIGTARGLLIVADNDNNDPAEHVPGSDPKSYADAFDMSTGQRLWRVVLPGGGEHMSIAGDLVFEFGGDDLIAYSLTDGRERWRTRLEVDTIERSGNLVMVSMKNRLAALDTATGLQRWSVSLPGRIGGALREGDTVFVGVSSGSGADSRGGVVAIAILDHSIRWQTQRRDAVLRAPILTSHGLAVLSNDPSVFCD